MPWLYCVFSHRNRKEVQHVHTTTLSSLVSPLQPWLIVGIDSRFLYMIDTCFTAEKQPQTSKLSSDF